MGHARAIAGIDDPATAAGNCIKRLSTLKMRRARGWKSAAKLAGNQATKKKA